MKKTFLALVALFCCILLYAPFSKAQIPAAYQVGTWQNFKTAAVTYTFDDNTSNQIPVAIPLLNTYGFKSTIFAVTQSMNPNWNSMRTAANAGHEIASHTVTHANLPDQSVSNQDTELKNSQSTINTQVTTQKCYTVAYPNCNIGDLTTVQKYYIAGRTCSGQIIPSSPTNFYSLSSIICGSTGVNTANDMNTRANSARTSGGWCVFLLHGIDNDGGYSPLASSVLSSHLSYVNTNASDYWVGTFGNVAKYIKERNAMSITETTVNADSLRMTPTDNLDNTIYDAAISIRRQLPSTWTTARVMQGGAIIPSTIVTISGVKYIQFDVVPDKGIYTLANATSTNTGCTTAAPSVTASVSYTQGATAAALTATGTSLKWYGTNATAGTASTTAPVPSTTTAGSATYYVSQTLNGCEGPRAAITVTVTTTTTTSTATDCGETGNGSYYSGVYRNMFKELLNKTDTEVKAKVNAAFQHFFYGSANQKLYYEVGADMAYILDVASNDVRSEGMSYGLMICVQLDKKAEFDKLWKWTKTHMQHSSGNLDGFFRWQLNTNGGAIDNNPAPDGEAYFITALFFAANRWGNGTGIYNYAAEAQSTLSKVQSKTGAGGINNLFNTNSRLITFGPNTGSYDYTDPSYNLPGFFELWGRWSTSNKTFWQQTPAASRKLLRDASHATSGLTTDYSNFDGTPKTTNFNSNSHRFMYDAWRSIMNIGMDYQWFQADAQQPVIAERYLNFFKNQGANYRNHYDWNGSNAGGDHSTGLVACNAVASLAVNNTALTTPFVQEFWNIGLPTGTYRYYDGVLYMLAMLNCSGDFKIWKPACSGVNPVVSLTAPANNATYAAGANVTLTATATDADGTISKVEFYNGTTLLNSTTASPYTYTWNAVAEGTYTITAVATDNSGNKTTSTAITITVGNPKKELINNGEFDNGTTGWAIQNNSGATGTMSVVANGNLSGTNSLRVCPSANPGTLEWHVQVSQTTPVVSGKMYTISFMAKAEAARQISVAIQELASPYTTYFSQTVDLTTTAQTFTFTYNADVTDAAALMKFYFGGNSSCVNIDKVSMSEGNFQLSAEITAAGVTTFCSGGSVVLNANTGTGYTYQWKKDAGNISGATSASYTASESGSYTVAVTANSQTATSTATVVTVNTAPSAPVVTATVAYCQNATAAQLTATGTALKWYANNTTTTALAAAPTPSTTATGTTTYFVSQTTSGCESSRAQITVTVNALPAATITAGGPTTFCNGGSVTLTSSAGSSYIWKNGTTEVGTGATYSATTAGSYTVEVTNANNCKATSSATVVTVNALPNAPTVTSAVAYCQNATAVQLTATGTALKWYANNTTTTALASAPTPSTTSAGTTTYFVSQTTNGCESARAQITVTVNALPTAAITAGGPTSFCIGGSVTLTSSAGSSYIWKNGTAEVGTGATYSATTSGSYTVEVTNANSCKATSTATVVTVNAVPNVPTVTATVAYCQNTTATQLTATGTGLKWYANNTTTTALASAPTPLTTTVGTTTYFVSQTTSGCESLRAQITVTVNALPTAAITAGGATTFCNGGSVTLTSSAGSSYIWKNGTAEVGTGSTYTANSAGSYTVEVTNANNCKATSTVTVVTINTAGIAPTVTSAVTYCQNAPATQLTATGTGLKWYANNTTATALASAPTPSTVSAGTTTYFVSQTTSGCESARTQITVTVNSLPTAAITTGGATTFCNGGSVTLTSSAGSSYIWKNGTAEVGTGATYTANSAGSYTVEVMNANNCKATSTATVVTVSSPPNAPTVISAVVYCQNAPAAQLTASGTGLKWYADNTTTTALASAPTPTTTSAGTTTYFVSQSTSGCESSRAQITVTVNGLPTATITPASSTTIPSGGSVTLNANTGTGLSYKWFKGSAEVGAGVSYVANAIGSYVVEVTNGSGCKATSLAVDVTSASNQPSVITITSPTPNTTIEGTITITANVSDPDGNITLVEYLDGNTVIGTSTSQPYSFDWTNPGSGTHVITVRVTDSNGGITTSAPVTITSESTTTGVNYSTSISATIYPNPSNADIYVETDMDLSNANFRVVNILGEEAILSASVNANGATLDVSSLTDGAYILIITKGTSIVRKKITVMK